ncbi:hypothetical protein MTO96_014255 [Rhipicephalus appendiculatus]
MAALRPGNDDKAWNDPPVFAYTEVQGTPAAAAPKRNLLNKRVPYPQDGIKPPSAPSVTGSAPPPTGPPTPSVPATPSVLATPSVPSPLKAAHSDDPTEAKSLKEETLSNLDKAVAQGAPNMEKRKQDDVRKRLDVLRSVWEQGKLSLPVQQRMHELALELLNGNHEKANALHISLMVDYVSEVSQWMLGIKHLILAAQAAQEKPASDTQEST